MRRTTRFSTKQQSAASDKPGALTAVDLEIASHHGTTAALDATPTRLQASKKAPAPSLLQRIEELTRENGQLRLEIKYYKQKLSNVGALREDLQFVTKELEEITFKFIKAEEEVDNDWYQAVADTPHA